ncbi:MAG: uridine kinase [Nocardioides sp.]|uniref:uridine kinase family protein n=1 Tax=Nocardioides sp. TaxID=35761 RepID=UPI003F108CB2
MGLSQTAAQVLTHAAGRPATLGEGRLICIDGPSGAGKTTLAAAVHLLAPDSVLLHTDAMLEGWDGLPGLSARLDALLRPLAAGHESQWHQWDWHASTWTQWHPVRPVPLLVLEGVGSAATQVADLVTTTVWVEAPEHLRLTRWWEREGEETIRFRDQWVADETALHRAERTRERADLLVDGTA